MKIFISWSGDQSKLIAEKLRDWLPNVLQFTKPWCSSYDISAGKFWRDAIREEIKASQYAILCLTKENLNAPWINYEAGAIAERLNGRVCPYLFQMSPDDLGKSPLKDLQTAKAADKEGTLSLLKALNERAKELGIEPLEDGRLSGIFKRYWQELDKSFKDEKLCHSPKGIQKDLEELASADSREDILLATSKLIEGLSTSVTAIKQQNKLQEKANELGKLVDYLERLNNIKADFPIWEEAEKWLRSNQENLVNVAIQKCLSLSEYAVLKNPGRELNSSEKVAEFRQNVSNYISWLLKCLEKKSDRIPCYELPIIFNRVIYESVFSHMKKFTQDDKHLSNDAKFVIAERLDTLGQFVFDRPIAKVIDS